MRTFPDHRYKSGHWDNGFKLKDLDFLLILICANVCRTISDRDLLFSLSSTFCLLAKCFIHPSNPALHNIRLVLKTTYLRMLTSTFMHSKQNHECSRCVNKITRLLESAGFTFTRHILETTVRVFWKRTKPRPADATRRGVTGRILC